MIGLLLGVVAILALFLWLVRRGDEPTRYRRPDRAGDIDYAELEAAEREVRDLDASARPGDDAVGDDWGPGTSRPRPPELL